MRYSRRKVGRGFAYIDSANQAVRDSKLIDFFRSLAIPPAWQDVEINPSTRAKIWAFGFDTKGRKQYIYNTRFRLKQDQRKFDRILQFAEKLPCIRSILAQHLRKRTLGRDKVLATAITLLDRGHFRPGNECYAKANKSYGLTTLRSKHLTIEGSTMIFDYRGKSGKRQRKKIVDQRLSKIVEEIDRLPGTEIFKFINQDGSICDVKSRDINAYIREYMGEEFSAKDFRTWAATVHAATMLDSIGTAENSSQRKTQHNIRRAVIAVSETLGNTPAIAKKSYIDPRIITCYVQGKTLSSCHKEVCLLQNKMKNLSVEELGVICLLNRYANRKTK